MRNRMLAAPLMAGNDLRTMLADTRGILTNREVIVIDQDPLGLQGTRVLAEGGWKSGPSSFTAEPRR